MKAKLLTAAILLGSSTAQAGIVVDGDLKDWIKQPTQGMASLHQAKPGVTATVDYLDQIDGGNIYDAEAIYTTQDTTHIHVAVVTQVSPGWTHYPAGDIAISFGGGQYKYGVVVKTDTSNALYNGGLGEQGQVYRVGEWNAGIAHGEKDGTNPTTIKSGNMIGSAAISYSTATFSGIALKDLWQYSGSHYLIEASIPKSLFSRSELLSSYTAHWAMTCYNDSISVAVPTGENIPEPTSLMLILMAIAMTGIASIDRSKKNAHL